MGVIDTIVGTGLGLALEDHNDERQLNQQRELGKIQAEQQFELNQKNQELAMKHWEDTGYGAQREQMEKAGLNVGLMYGGAGSGGQSFSGGGNVSGGNAPQGGREVLDMQQLGLQREMQEAQIENVKADTNVKKEQAPNVTADTETKNKTRDLLIENMKQEGISNFQDNKMKAWLMSDENQRKETDYNDKYDYHVAVGEESQYAKQISSALLKTASETQENLKGIELTNKKIQYYWNELVNETKKANSQEIQANAQKLSAEWNTGEYTNWKTWAETATKAIQALSGAVKGTGKKEVNINQPTNTTTNTHY